jgi:hypothetical protein
MMHGGRTGLVGIGVTAVALLGACGTASSTADSGVADAGGGGGAALLVGMTLHLENKTFDSAYFASLDSFAKTFEGHGGRLTLEPRESCVTAAGGSPALFDWKTLEARGHSVGSHAAIGGVNPMSVADFTADAKARYDQLKPKVNRLDHVSGNCGDVDWVKGVVDAGFSATTAATVMCMYPMPAASRPAPYQTFSCTAPTDPVCHTAYPTDPAQRIHPWRVSSGATWLTDDPAGKLVIFAGSGSLPCLEEEATSTGAGLPKCTFTQEDVTRALATLDTAIGLVDPAKVNTFYWVWGSWALSAQEQPVLEAFLAEVDKRVAKGQVKWSSIGTMLDTYVAWEKTHR